jgi:succinate dehydrogenase / fumarate reductase iron-sulfur subunit
MLVRLKIRRYQPETSQKPYYQSFQVDVPEKATVLDSLLEVRDYLDGTLNLRASCRSAICGSCGMRINGVSRLACKTLVVDAAPRGREITVEPLANLPVIKDLVADMEPFWRKHSQVTPWLVTDEGGEKTVREHLMDNKLALYLTQFAACIQCGVCYSACPIVAIDDDYLGPAALAKAWRYSRDSRDHGKRLRLARVADEQGLWRCHTIFSCAEQCPKRVNPTEAIQQLKKMVILTRLGLAR